MSEVATTELEQMINQRNRAKLLASRREMVLRLYKNKDFKALILDGFCLTEAARYVQESSDPLLNADQRADALAMAQASGHLKRFLSITAQMGYSASNDLPELEEAVSELRAQADRPSDIDQEDDVNPTDHAGGAA